MKIRQPSTSPGGLPPSQACNLGNDVTGTVSHLEEEGGFFWLQRDPARVEEIAVLLESEAEQLVEDQPCLAVGDVVVAQWQGALYRAVVLAENDIQDVLLHFVDWGNGDWVPRSRLRLAKQVEIQEPPLAIRWISLNSGIWYFLTFVRLCVSYCLCAGADWKDCASADGRRNWKELTIL